MSRDPGECSPVACFDPRTWSPSVGIAVGDAVGQEVNPGGHLGAVRRHRWSRVAVRTSGGQDEPHPHPLAAFDLGNGLTGSTARSLGVQPLLTPRTRPR